MKFMYLHLYQTKNEMSMFSQALQSLVPDGTSLIPVRYSDFFLPHAYNEMNIFSFPPYFWA